MKIFQNLKESLRILQKRLAQFNYQERLHRYGGCLWWPEGEARKPEALDGRYSNELTPADRWWRAAPPIWFWSTCTSWVAQVPWSRGRSGAGNPTEPARFSVRSPAGSSADRPLSAGDAAARTGTRNPARNSQKKSTQNPLEIPINPLKISSKSQKVL